MFSSHMDPEQCCSLVKVLELVSITNSTSGRQRNGTGFDEKVVMQLSKACPLWLFRVGKLLSCLFLKNVVSGAVISVQLGTKCQ